MERHFKRQLFRGRKVFQSELRLILRYGTEAAWLNAAGSTSDPERWRNVLNKLRPWESDDPNLCTVIDGTIVLIDCIYIRIPDNINQLAEPKIERICIDKSKNPLTEKTEWIYLTAGEPSRKLEVTFPTKRGYGQPRKKINPF